MQSLYRASRYLLPAAFAVYAIVANVAFFRQPEVPDVPLAWSSLQGAPTAELDSIYKKSLPHREASIGLWGAARYLAMGEGRKGVLAGQDGWLFTNEEARSADADVQAATVERILGINDTLKAQGIQLVLVPVPAKLDVQRDMAGLPGVSDEMAAQYAGFVGQLQAADVAVVDMRAGLLDREAFYRTDTHWNKVGVEAAAQAVAGVVPKGDMVFSATDGLSKTFTGDLVSYVTTDRMAPAIGLAPESVTPMVATAADAAGDLFGNAGADVVLVGTSYSANADWSFAEALKVALGRDVLNYAEQGQGPARPMLAYMASSDLQDMPPKVVIWEFPIRYLADPKIWDAPAVKVASNGG
jgi:alginate O-acetyltransferase complex protein AlgJ